MFGMEEGDGNKICQINQVLQGMRSGRNKEQVVIRQVPWYHFGLDIFEYSDVCLDVQMNW